jgi:galactokinase
MHFPTLDSQVQTLKAAFTRLFPAEADQAQVMTAPYRITPLGAHVDHQGGQVLGRAIDAHTILLFVPREGPQCQLFSLNYPGEVVFRLDDHLYEEDGDWGRYVRGAARVLSANYGIRRGIIGMVAGTLPASGLSSSASVGLVFLHAIAHANGLALDPWEYIELDRQLENNYLGLNNGIQDQAIIELSHLNAFVHLDVPGRMVDWVPDPPNARDVRFLVAFSGFPRDLVATGYNDRVAECRQAAEMLSRLGGSPEARILGEVEAAVYQTFLPQLPEALQRRARHYFDEIKRVKEGCTAWERGAFQTFGRLMAESCKSSINNFETGTREIIALQEITLETPGVLGSRFSGGGFGGCTIGLVETDRAQAAVESIRIRFVRKYPEKERVVKVYLAGYSDGVGTKQA